MNKFQTVITVILLRLSLVGAVQNALRVWPTVVVMHYEGHKT